MYKIIYFNLALILLPNFCHGQSGCHALFGFQQSGTTLTVNFADSTTSSTPITSWFWDFGDGHSSTNHNPHRTYAHSGTYEVCLTVHNNHGCNSTYCRAVTVSTIQPECHALFGFQQSDTTLTVNFADSTISSTPITSWLWDFGDGHGSTTYNTHHTYAHAGTYEVCLTVHNNHGCSSTYCHPVTVSTIQPECHVLFGFQQSDTTFTVNFADSTISSTPITSWLWDFGDGHSSTNHNPHHTYSHAGTYVVCLTVHNNHGCSSTYCHAVTIHATAHECIALFTSHYDSKSNQMRFFNTSSYTTDHTQYLWNFGDGHSSTSENPNHTYSHTGIYTVCLFISDEITGCNSHICTEVEIDHIWHAMVANKDQFVLSRSKANEVTEPETYIEFGNFPNPFISNTTIPYELKSDSHLNIEMYDLSGRLIHQIFKGDQSKGSHTWVLSGDYLIDKMYILKIVINDKIFHKKLLVAN